jgi:hypothetical protein
VPTGLKGFMDVQSQLFLPVASIRIAALRSLERLRIQFTGAAFAL